MKRVKNGVNGLNLAFSRAFVRDAGWGSVALFLLMALIFVNAAAAEPPSWSEFEVKSGNGSHIAEVKAKEKIEGKDPSELEYIITVSKLEGETKTELWTCDYTYNGKPGGLLSNDGMTFVYVEFFYHPDTPVVTIYHNGEKTGSLCGNDFEIDEALLKGMAPNILWLFEESPRYRFVRSGALPVALEVKTIDGMTHLINVKTGSFFGGAG
ncbi:MAG: hypothetical protein JXB26_16935 [Candidatus Aminicenantes bacterium]|nr:hypothetical protein [Candidatus Aminicenantes bacterium]